MERRARPRVVIVGGGFGGLTAAQALAHAPVDVIVIDRRNHHLFQPLLYQVAMAGLSPADISAPIRGVLARQKNATVLLEEVESVDYEARHVITDVGQVAYDFLILATGMKSDYFGHPEWEDRALGLKCIEDALEIRRRVLLAFELAERELAMVDDDAARERAKSLLTFVVIGGGPTGVELAGALRELSLHVLSRDFRRIDPRSTRVLLLEAGDRVLASFPKDLSEKAAKQLRELGVEIRTGTRVTRIEDDGRVAEDRAAGQAQHSDGRLVVSFGGESLVAGAVVWAAGVRPTRLNAKLGVATDRHGRVIVERDASIPGHPEVFAIGDMALMKDDDGNALPGLSPVAMQEARFVAKAIVRTLRGEPRGTFSYFDKGTMATIGRSRAVAETGKLHLSGFIAWLAWLVVHLWYLVGFRNRLMVMIEWAWSYFTYQRGARLISGRADRSLATHVVAAREHPVEVRAERVSAPAPPPS